jgi:UDP-2,3-diacylglucosamine hydrolase
LRQAGARTLVHGHTHRPARHDLGDGLERWVLSDWDLDGPVPRGDVLRWSTNGLARLPLTPP